MTEPTDFGLSDVGVFAHIGDPTPGPEHSVFWKHWFESLIEHRPVLARRETPDASDPGATHQFRSLGGVSIGCRLVLPADGPVGASLVVVHGYSVSTPLEAIARRWHAVADTGVAVLLLRLRGYPGSQLGIGDQTTPDDNGCGWIGRGLTGERDEQWIVPAAVADVSNACRVMRNALLGRDTDASIPVTPASERPGVYLHGTSLGGGLAAIAAAQLIGKLSGDPIIDRLALAVPSLGDWGWRLRNGRAGMTAEINRLIGDFPHHRDRVLGRLQLCDAAIHGRRIRVPTLAMLARRDEVVPAPSAAAVFNAIDADPGRKWRFVVPYGHFAGGIANARRHALFERAMVDFFDPSRSPIEAMTPWEPILHEGVEDPQGHVPGIAQANETEK